MNTSKKSRVLLALGLCLGLGGCATQFKIPSPVPEPLAEHTVGAPVSDVWAVSLRALESLGFSPAESDQDQGTLVTAFRALDGNTAHNRTAGVARFAVERDIYATGRSRLLIRLLSLGELRTRVRVAAELQAKVRQRGDIRYDAKPGQQQAFPLITGDAAADDEKSRDDWEPLISNGVLEDRFLAELLSQVSATAVSTPPPGDE